MINLLNLYKVLDWFYIIYFIKLVEVAKVLGRVTTKLSIMLPQFDESLPLFFVFLVQLNDENTPVDSVSTFELFRSSQSVKWGRSDSELRLRSLKLLEIPWASRFTSLFLMDFKFIWSPTQTQQPIFNYIRIYVTRGEPELSELR